MTRYPVLTFKSRTSIDLPKECPGCKSRRIFVNPVGAIYQCGGAYSQAFGRLLFTGYCKVDLDPRLRSRTLGAVLEQTYLRLVDQKELEAGCDPLDVVRIFCDSPYLWKQFRHWDLPFVTLRKKQQLARWFKGLSPKNRIRYATKSIQYFRKETEKTHD